MRVAYAGVAHSHPFADAANLLARGCTNAAVWDADDPAAQAEFTSRFVVETCGELSEIGRDRADVIVATSRTFRASNVAEVCARAGLPAFFNKTIASDLAQLDAWLSVSGAPKFTSSVLRFAPQLLEKLAHIEVSDIRAIDIDVQHDFHVFTSASRRWQDDPTGAGGTMINVGLHAWEMLDVILPGVEVDQISATRTLDERSLSEVLAKVLCSARGIQVGVSISGLPGPDVYRMVVHTTRGRVEVDLPSTQEGLGYHGLADAIVLFGQTGRVPVSAVSTRAVYRNAIRVAEAARGNKSGELTRQRALREALIVGDEAGK